MSTRPFRPFLTVLIGLTLSNPAFCQTDPSQFATVLNAPGDVIPTNDILMDTQVNIYDGAVLSSVIAGYNGVPGEASEVNMYGGSLYTLIVGNASRANILGGTIQQLLAAGPVEVNIAGGTVAPASASVPILRATDGATINFSGGSTAIAIQSSDRALIANGSTINLSGGDGKARFYLEDNSTASFSGGQGEFYFYAPAGNTVNIFGTSFELDGIPIDPATLNTPFEITTRGRGHALTGTLQDGSPFVADLSDDTGIFSNSYYHPDATLNIILVPEPTCGAIGVALFASILSGRRRRGPA